MKMIERVETFANAFDVRETNNSPILAICNDFNTYVIKHTRGNTPCNRLAIELISTFFLKKWKIFTPDIALVIVKEEHLQEKLSSLCQPAFFTLPCFGSKFERYGKEFTQFMNEISSYEKQKFPNKNDFLKLAFFDIWMANEDRTYNNPNILIISQPDGYHVCAIDHEQCCNGGNLVSEPYLLTFEDSILSHPAVKHILGRDFNHSENNDRVLEDIYICIESCKSIIDESLLCIPDEWQINSVQYKQSLLDKIFSSSWIETTKATFFEHLEQADNL